VTTGKGKKDGGVNPPLQKARVLSGMRPTGRMHIGNYFGALQNWVRLQNEVGEKGPAYECFYFIADWHSLTSDYADTSAIAQNVIEIATDYLAGGLDPKKCVIFQQSLVPEHAELHLLLSMVTPLGWLERVPTYKEALENIKDKDLHMYGFLGYPVLQCGDIVMYGNLGARLFVPVGEDQVSHVETSREIVRRFNLHMGLQIDLNALINMSNKEFEKLMEDVAASSGSKAWTEVLEDRLPGFETERRVRHNVTLMIRHQAVASGLRNFLERNPRLVPYVAQHDTLVEPEAMLTKTPKIPGLDGRKMSKSYGNTIMLSESDADIRAKTKVMVTDPARKRRTDPGNPDVCPVYDWHKLFSAEEPGRLEWVRKGCTTAGIGCIECKEAMATNLIKWITPVRERRVEYEKHPKRVLEVIEEGSEKARKVAQGTMERVREAVFGWEKKRKEIDGAAGSAKA
jgi:tryptophanyl-tRNA synthetase